jgi:smad nuclear-interacting protein 1
MAQISRSPSPSGSRPFRRHYDDDNAPERRQPPRKDYEYRDRGSYRRSRSERDSRDYRNSDRERDRGRYSREGGRRRNLEDRAPATSSRRSASPPSRAPRYASRRNSRSPPPRSSRPRSRSRSRTKHDDNDDEERKKEEDKLKPNFNRSGLLAAETKTVKHADGTNTVLKYHEPPEARKPMLGWRLYVFKGSEQVGE